jgi:NTP pyrophosphatase (non-canonical NTP hydrolase)
MRQPNLSFAPIATNPHLFSCNVRIPRFVVSRVARNLRKGYYRILWGAVGEWTVNEALETLRKFRDERDWAKFHTPKDLAVSISVEAGELLELFQWRHDGHNIEELNVRHVAEEAADVVIYALLLFDRLGLDPTEEVLEKIRRNAQKFPIEESFGVPGAFKKRA